MRPIRPDAHFFENAKIGPGVTCQGFGMGQQVNLNLHPPTRQFAGYYKAVAAVVPGSAEDDRCPGFRKTCRQNPADGKPRPFHQNHTGNTDFVNRAGVNGLHLGCGCDLHGVE